MPNKKLGHSQNTPNKRRFMRSRTLVESGGSSQHWFDTDSIGDGYGKVVWYESLSFFQSLRPPYSFAAPGVGVIEIHASASLAERPKERSVGWSPKVTESRMALLLASVSVR